jgi:hypothetical protein
MKFPNKIVQGFGSRYIYYNCYDDVNSRALISEDDWDMSDTNTIRCVYQVPARYLIIIIIVNIPCGHILYIIYSCGWLI